MDWFLYDNGLRHERVNQFFSFGMVAITKTQVTFFSNVEATREKSAIWWQYSIYLQNVCKMSWKKPFKDKLIYRSTKLKTSEIENWKHQMYLQAAIQRCSFKKMFLKTSQKFDKYPYVQFEKVTESYWKVSKSNFMQHCSKMSI